MSIPAAPDPVSSGPQQQGSDQPLIASDPLLQNGSFIDANSNISSTIQQTPPRPCSSAKGSDIETETPIKSRRKVPVTVAPGAAATESPNWLPPGWLVEDRVRSSGATAGTVDKYYIEPKTGRRFRSKKEVQYYLETGSVKRKKRGTENAESDVNLPDFSGSRNNKKAGKNTKRADMQFDYLNVPNKIEWVLTEANGDTWTPFIGGKKVPEYDRQNWEFEMLHSHH